MLSQSRQLRLDDGRPEVPMEEGRPGADHPRPPPAQVLPGEVRQRLLQHQDQHRRVQLPHGGPHLQAGVLLLPADNLRALLHARHRVLGQLLARPQRCPRQGLPGRHHPAHHVHAAGLYQQLAAAGGLHEGYRRVDGGVHLLRVRGAARVRTRQLRLKIRRSETRQAEAEEAGGARQVRLRPRAHGRPQRRLLPHEANDADQSWPAGGYEEFFAEFRQH